MGTKREVAIIVVDSNKLLFYTKKVTNTLQLNIPSDVINNLEVANREKLDHLITSLFRLPNLKGEDFDITLIFSKNTTFEKELTSTSTKSEYDETQKFLDMVPFEEVLSNTYRVNKKTRVVAVNKILYNVLKQSLERNKAHVGLVIPLTILEATNPELNNKIDFPFIENKLESFDQYSMLDLEKIGLGGEVANSIGIKKKDVRLYILVLVMIILFLVLIYMFYTTFIAVPRPVHRTFNNVPASSPTTVNTGENNLQSSNSAQVSGSSESASVQNQVKQSP